MGGLAGPGGQPMALGHEIAGVVRAVGAEVAEVAVGQRVVVHPGGDDIAGIGVGSAEGGLASAVLVREAARGGRLFPVPDSLPLDVAALAEPVAVGMHAAEQLDVGVGDKVAVFGCGPIGLAAIATLADRGLTDVVGIDLSATRRDLAQRVGAATTLDPAAGNIWRGLERIHGTTSDKYTGRTTATKGFIEASGSDRVLTDIIDRAATAFPCQRGGAALQPGAGELHQRPDEGADHPRSIDYPARFSDAVDLLGRRDLSAMITDRFPLSRLDEALRLLEGSKECGKVLIDLRAGNDGYPAVSWPAATPRRVAGGT